RVAKYAGAPGGSNDIDVFGPTAKQLIEFSVYLSTNANDVERPTDLLTGNTYILNRTENYYAGQNLTWLSGPLAGRTTRIVKYRYALPTGPNPPLNTHRAIFTIVASPVNDGAILLPNRGSRSPELTQLANISEGNNFGAKFLINGRPFNGTGVGYNSL